MTKITDDDDNLVDVYEGGHVPVEDDLTKTPGGNCKLELDLDRDVIEDLINHWASTTLHEASLEQYEEVLASDGQEAAVYSAVLNDLIIDALTSLIIQAEAEPEDAA